MGSLKDLSLVASLLLMAGCGPAAAADTTLRYASADDPDDTLVIEASGDRVRAEEGNGQMIIVRDGESYVVFSPPSGGQAIARIEDYEAVGAEIRARMVANGAFTSAEDNTPYEIEEQGERPIRSWRGNAYEISPVGAPGVMLTLVVSTDPALAEARQVAVPAFQAFERVSRAILVYPGAFVRLSDEVLGRGMPISVSGRALQSIGHDPVAAARFELPGPVLSRDQLRARLAQ